MAANSRRPDRGMDGSPRSGVSTFRTPRPQWRATERKEVAGWECKFSLRMAQSGRIWHSLAGFRLDLPDWGVLSSTETDSVFVFSGLASRGRRRTVGLEAVDSAQRGRAQPWECLRHESRDGFCWVPGRWRLDGTDMSPRMATRHVWRRAPRPAAGTFCRRRGCSHPRKGGFGNSGVGLFRSRALPFSRSRGLPFFAFEFFHPFRLRQAHPALVFFG